MEVGGIDAAVLTGASLVARAVGSRSAGRVDEVVEMKGARIVVGVELDEDAAVVEAAAEFARHFDATLVCVISDASRYAVREDADGRVTSLDIDADDPEERQETFDASLRAQVDAILRPLGVEWTARAMAGDPALQLAHVADEVDARMIVVGTRRPGRWGTMREFLNGSVAAHLAHRQRRPVVVIPLSPVQAGAAVPWQGG